MKRQHTYLFISIFSLLLSFVSVGCCLGGAKAAVNFETEATEIPSPAVPTVGATGTPVPTYEPAVSPDPAMESTVSPDSTDEPEPKPSVKQLKKVQKVTATRYSTHEIKISWKKQKKAKFYKIYYSNKKNGKYHCVGTTKKLHFLVRHLKNHKNYYFYVRACRKRKAVKTDSLPSKKVFMKTRTYSRKTIFAGDSICQGIAGWTIPVLYIGGQKKVVAYKGLNTVTYHTKRIFGGRTGLQKLIAEKPYRVYLMLGINEIHFRRWPEMIREYEGMVRAMKQASPGTDIVLCAVSPVTARERARRDGFHQIPIFNRHLRRMAKRIGVKYLDYTGFLKDSRGYLKGNYAQPDGYHWRPPAYQQFAKIIQKYDLSLDR